MKREFRQLSEEDSKRLNNAALAALDVMIVQCHSMDEALGAVVGFLTIFIGTFAEPDKRREALESLYNGTLMTLERGNDISGIIQ